MKRTLMAIACAALTTFTLGCKPAAETSAPETTAGESRKATAKQLDKIDKDAKEAAQDMKDYAYAQKAEFVAKMQGQLDDINRDLDVLAAKIEKSNAAAKAEAKPKIQALRDQATTLTKQLDAAKDATESAWGEVKTGFKKGYGELKEGFQKARQWASDTIAP